MHTDRSASILLVEDDDPLRRLIARVLSNAGYDVIEAVNGEDALNRYAAHAHIDLLITDVVMPKIGGLELADLLCARDPGLRIVYMSGYSETLLPQNAALRRDAAWMTKPFSPSELLRETRNGLDGGLACSA
jgi:two-component system, cell cycle sensor histidine kinase and response regulator CckA